MPVQKPESIPTDLLNQLRRVSTGTACGELLKLGIRCTYMEGIHPLTDLGPDNRVVGRAVTVRLLPAREDVVQAMTEAERAVATYREPIDTLEPNDVLVFDAMGLPEAAIVGDILCARMKQRGGAATVVDGAVRDVIGLREVGFPVFARHIHAAPSFPYYVFASDVNVPIQCGGVLVMPGDVILADLDGVLVVPRSLAMKVAEEGFAHEALETFIRSKVEKGLPVRGIYPPTDALKREYEEYLSSLK